ncbi:MAG: biotin/lipoyl-binding protein, partial [Bacteroidota bacterium]
METIEKKRGKGKRFIIIGSILATVAIIGGIYYFQSMGYETTDNAQLDADIIPVRTSISGYVKEIRFKDHQSVKKGDTLLMINDDEFQARVLQSEAALENA